MLKTLLLAAALLAGTSHAAPLKDADPLRAKGRVASSAPQQMRLVFDLYRNGHKLGQVTDSFDRSGNRYTLVSETRAAGPLEMLWPGAIRLESSGAITAQGLQPAQFQHARSDAPHKLASASLDWAQRRIDFRYKGQTRTVDGLQDGAQDQLSQLYQFMFMPRLPAELALQVVSGRDLNDYRYVQTDGGMVATPLGSLRTRQYQRVGQQPDEKAITVWVAPARDNLPVRVRVVEDGVVLEQRLLSAQIGR
ncbi:MAG: DUF3108 domain-containing protein [Pseudomonadota bacterium]